MVEATPFLETIAFLIIIVFSIINIITIGDDIAGVSAVLGSLLHINWPYLVLPITLFLSYIILFKNYHSIKKILLGFSLILFAYIITGFIADPNWPQIIKDTFIPQIDLSTAYIIAAMGLLGTPISPYLLFWQASEELEEHKAILQVKEVRWTTILGMFFSNLISFFIIIAAAETLFRHNLLPQTLQEAASVLKPLSGHFAYALFVAGILASGFLAIPVIAGSTAYAISDLFKFKEGLGKTPIQAKGFYTVFIGALFIGDLIALTPFGPLTSLYYSQVLGGLFLPFLILTLLLLANDKKIMGKYTNSRTENVISFAALAIVTSLMIFTLIRIL